MQPNYRLWDAVVCERGRGNREEHKNNEDDRKVKGGFVGPYPMSVNFPAAPGRCCLYAAVYLEVAEFKVARQKFTHPSSVQILIMLDG